MTYLDSYKKIHDIFVNFLNFINVGFFSNKPIMEDKEWYKVSFYAKPNGIGWDVDELCVDKCTEEDKPKEPDENTELLMNFDNES